MTAADVALRFFTPIELISCQPANPPVAGDGCPRVVVSCNQSTRCLPIEREAHNVVPISQFSLRGLEINTARGANRYPQQCMTADLASADFVVATKEAVRRLLMRKRFAEPVSRFRPSASWSRTGVSLVCLRPLDAWLRRRNPPGSPGWAGQRLA
jgi:hypothetical protein